MTIKSSQLNPAQLTLKFVDRPLEETGEVCQSQQRRLQPGAAGQEGISQLAGFQKLTRNQDKVMNEKQREERCYLYDDVWFVDELLLLRHDCITDDELACALLAMARLKNFILDVPPEIVRSIIESKPHKETLRLLERDLIEGHPYLNFDEMA